MYNQQGQRYESKVYRGEHNQHQHMAQHQQHYVQQQQQQQPKLKQPDFRTSTDFLKCEKRLTLKELANSITHKPSENKDIDYDFLSSSAIVEKVNQLRVSRNVLFCVKCNALITL